MFFALLWLFYRAQNVEHNLQLESLQISGTNTSDQNELSAGSGASIYDLKWG